MLCNEGLSCSKQDWVNTRCCDNLFSTKRASAALGYSHEDTWTSHTQKSPQNYNAYIQRNVKSHKAKVHIITIFGCELVTAENEGVCFIIIFRYPISHTNFLQKFIGASVVMSLGHCCCRTHVNGWWHTRHKEVNCYLIACSRESLCYRQIWACICHSIYTRSFS